jgi:hypothetical protein
MNEERAATYRNPVQTPLQSSCRLCHYAGFSNLCTFFQGGECPYIAMRKTFSREVKIAD